LKRDANEPTPRRSDGANKRLQNWTHEQANAHIAGYLINALESDNKHGTWNMAKNRDRGRTRSFFAVSFQTNKYRIPIDLRLAKERGLGLGLWMELHLHRQRSGFLSERRRRLLDK